MTYRGHYNAVSRENENVVVRYMCVPGTGAMVAASPQNFWGTGKNGCPIEQSEYITAMAEVLFQQLTPEDQREVIAMCEELAAEQKAETGGIDHE